MTHPRLSARPLPEQEREIQDSKTALEKALGRSVTAFAYPFGSPEDFSEETVRIVERLGFERAFSTAEKHSAVTIDRFVLPTQGRRLGRGRARASHLTTILAER